MNSDAASSGEFKKSHPFDPQVASKIIGLSPEKSTTPTLHRYIAALESPRTEG